MQVTDNMSNRRTLIVLAVVCAFLHLALAPNVGIVNGHPDFMLILAGSIALWQGGSVGVAFGFGAGLFFDFTTTGPVGLMALLLCASSWAIGFSGRNRFAEGWSVACLYFLVMDAVVCSLYSITMILVGQASSIFDTLFLRALPSIALTMVFFFPFLFVLSGRPGGTKSIGRHTPNTIGRSNAPRLDMKGF
ncbi:MAG: rod shape-determining protein MreD [Atopobiaceae bacterium]|nr:rod shape-determining protein MreD [Atopobiaceae bacterium]